MFIIVGLGNPTPEYEGTRHNVGFEVIDALARKYNIDVDTKKHRAYIGKGMIEGQKVILAKPQTYMNLSGESVRSLLDYYKVDEEQELLVIYDDISLGVGQIRIRAKGSAGGHNGIKNIIAHLGGQVFPRIKVGVGEKPPKWDLIIIRIYFHRLRLCHFFIIKTDLTGLFIDLVTYNIALSHRSQPP